MVVGRALKHLFGGSSLSSLLLPLLFSLFDGILLLEKLIMDISFPLSFESNRAGRIRIIFLFDFFHFFIFCLRNGVEVPVQKIIDLLLTFAWGIAFNRKTPVSLFEGKILVRFLRPILTATPAWVLPDLLGVFGHEFFLQHLLVLAVLLVPLFLEPRIFIFDRLLPFFEKLGRGPQMRRSRFRTKRARRIFPGEALRLFWNSGLERALIFYLVLLSPLGLSSLIE